MFSVLGQSARLRLPWTVMTKAPGALPSADPVQHTANDCAAVRQTLLAKPGAPDVDAGMAPSDAHSYGVAQRGLVRFMFLARPG